MTAARRHLLGAFICALLLVLPAAAHAATPARVQGRFSMQALVTRAVGLHGEHRGQRLRRTWRIAPQGCHHDTCATLQLRRTLAGGRSDRVSLHRQGNRSYVGHGVFFVALSCRGRVHRHGSRVPFTITLRVTATRTIGGISFAQRLTATYVNPKRTEATPCSIRQMNDAAAYSGHLVTGTPAPPRASFSSQVTPGTAVAFTATSRPGSGRGGRLTHWHWDFGDPASGAANLGTGRTPPHAFSAPGDYRVTLTVSDHAGLSATVRQTVVVP